MHSSFFCNLFLDRLSSLDYLSYLPDFLFTFHWTVYAMFFQMKREFLALSSLTEKHLLHCVHRHCVFSRIEKWLRISFLRLRKHMDESMLRLVICSLLTRHLLQHFFSWITHCCLPIVFVNINLWNLDWHLSCSFWILSFFICTIFK